MALLVILGAVPAVAAADEPSVEDVGNIMVAFGAHLESHPFVGAEDLYKFLHQAVYGPGHAIPDREAAAKWLEKEMAGLGPAREGEPLCEALGGAPRLVRVNLRPFAAAGGDPSLLFDAFETTAGRVHGDPMRMETVASLAVSYVQCAGRGELAPELKALTAELAGRGYPPIHHSEAYTEAYQPAYRVVEADVAAEHGWCD